MTTIPQNRRIMYAVSYFVALCVIAAALLGCSPYAARIATETPTAAPSVTATEQFITGDKLTPTPRPHCTVTAYTLNMRRAGRMTAAVKQILYNGDTLQVIRHAGEWLKVSTGTATGFIYSAYCR
jgi:hypothetical protein